MIENPKLYAYLMNFMEEAISIFIDEKYPNVRDEEYIKIRDKVEKIYTTEASIIKVWEDISIEWLEILERLEIKKFCNK